MTNIKNYKKLIAFHPGSYVEDIIEDLNITQQEFAQRLDTTPKSVSKLVNGEEKLSDELALKLSKLTGISLDTWLALQKKYDAKVLEIKDEEQAEQEARIAAQIDFSFFNKHNLVEDRRYSLKEKIDILRAKLHISNLSFLIGLNPAISFRNTVEFTDNTIINANVLLEIASNKARNSIDEKLNKQKLKQFLPQIKDMTHMAYEEFYPTLEKELKNCGVILVALPSLKNAQIYGATKKFKNGSVMLLINDRSKDAGTFWFSLVHEIGHIINSDFDTSPLSKKEYVAKEKRADDFAKDFFIEPKDYSTFVELKDFSIKAIISFSKKQGIDPCILRGRLQKEELIPYSALADLKKTYTIAFS